MFATIARKFLLALPILIVLLLARCASPESDANNKSASEFTPEQVQAVLEMLQSKSDAASSAGEEYSAEEIKTAMREHIARRTKLGIPGVFEITDLRTSHQLKLRFVKIHDPVRTLGGDLYFACTKFVAAGNPDKAFDLDFWLQPVNGELKVYQENVHKLPVFKDGEWALRPRYNFVDDRIHLLR